MPVPRSDLGFAILLNILVQAVLEVAAGGINPSFTTDGLCLVVNGVGHEALALTLLQLSEESRHVVLGNLNLDEVVGGNVAELVGRRQVSLGLGLAILRAVLLEVDGIGQLCTARPLLGGIPVLGRNVPLVAGHPEPAALELAHVLVLLTLDPLDCLGDLGHLGLCRQGAAFLLDEVSSGADGASALVAQHVGEGAFVVGELVGCDDLGLGHLDALVVGAVAGNLGVEISVKVAKRIVAVGVELVACPDRGRALAEERETELGLGVLAVGALRVVVGRGDAFAPEGPGVGPGDVSADAVLGAFPVLCFRECVFSLLRGLAVLASCRALVAVDGGRERDGEGADSGLYARRDGAARLCRLFLVPSDPLRVDNDL